MLHFLKSSYAVLFLQLHPQKEDMSLWSLHANYSIQHLTPIFCFKLEWEVYLQPNNWCYALFFFLKLFFRSIIVGKLLKRGDCSERLSFSRNYGAEVSKACWRAYSSSIGRGRKHFRGSFAKLLFFFLTYFFPKIRFFFSHNCFPGIYQWEEHTWS